MLGIESAALRVKSRLLAAGSPEVMVAQSWQQALDRLIPEQGCVVILHQSFLPVPDECLVPVVLLNTGSAVAGALPAGVTDSIPEQLEARELLRCLRFANERHQLLMALARAGSDDPLTGCCNRQMLQDRLQQSMHRAVRGSQPLAVLLLDLDSFSHINDTLGHDAGDLIIREVADRLRNTLRARDTVGRMGSDEFAVIIEEYGTPGNLMHVVKKVVDALSEPFRIDAESLLLGSSIGIATFPEGGQTVDQLLLNASLAMQQAKRQQGPRVREILAERASK